MKNGSPIAGSEILTSDQRHDEYVMLALRSKGIDINDYKSNFDGNWLTQKEELINKYSSDGFLVLEDNFIKFSPKGYSLCDEIVSNLYN